MGSMVQGLSRQRRILALGVIVFLAGCTSQPPQNAQISIVSAIGTPFFIAAKIPVCAVTLAAAGPFGALQGLAAPGERDSLQPDIRPALDAGVVDNCGPPYLLPPY